MWGVKKETTPSDSEGFTQMSKKILVPALRREHWRKHKYMSDGKEALVIVRCLVGALRRFRQAVPSSCLTSVSMMSWGLAILSGCLLFRFPKIVTVKKNKSQSRF